jgi:hypothetical protein
MYYELTEQEETELIDKLARVAVSNGTESYLISFLEMLKPVSRISSQLIQFTAAPYLTLFGQQYEEMGYKYLRLFEKKENIQRIIQQIGVAKKAKESSTELLSKGSEEKAKPKSVWRKIFEKLF